MKTPSLIPALALIFLLSAIAACKGPASQAEPQSMEITLLQSGNMELKVKKGSPRTIYVDIRDATGHVPLTPEVLPAMLTEDNFDVVDNPSKAAYILHISLLEEGQVDPALLEKLVQKGYDSEASFAGEGASAWLADALLVQRRVPEAQRESHVRLKNISTRNALASSQMRLAVSTPEQLKGRKAFAQAFVRPLAQAIREALVKPEPAISPAPSRDSSARAGTAKQ